MHPLVIHSTDNLRPFAVPLRRMKGVCRVSSEGVNIEGLSIFEEIGRGGFAVVYRAHDSDFGRDVAVKMLQSRLDTEGLARFQRECAAVGVISNHPHIVAVHRSGVTADGKAYLVMELLSGGSLAARAAVSPLTWPEAISLGVAVAGALETAHRAGVLHRDVKPENVLFSAFQAPVLVDFGIAAVRGGYETRSTAITASLAHAAPEVIAGSRASAASDVYALASTVFFSLSGHAPFTDTADETLIPLIARIATAPPPDLRAHGVPDAVAAVIESALAKDAGARPVTAAAFAEALCQAAAEAGAEIAPVILPVVSSTGSVSGRETETGVVNRHRHTMADPAPVAVVRRRRTLLVGIAAVIAMLMIGGSAKAWSDRGTRDLKALTQASRTSTLPTPTPSVTKEASKASGSRTRLAPTHSASARQPVGSVPAEQPAGSVPVEQPAGSVPAGPPAPAPRPVPATVTQNRAPTLAAVGSQVNNELSSVSMRLQGSDPDGNRLTYSATGLPAGLSISSSSGMVSGAVSSNAANATTDRRQGLKYQAFTVTMRVSDGKASASRSLTWRVLDTHRTMPNYFGKFGCNGDPGCQESVPNVAAVSTPDFLCSTTGTLADSTIKAQNVSPGSVIRWGQAVTYTYKQASC